MSNLYCRASASIKAQVGGHGELLKVIAAEKISKAEQKTYVKSQQEAVSAAAKWAEQEPDSFLRDALLRSLELKKTWIESQAQMSSAMRVYRQTFEDILSQEKAIEPVLKAQKKAQKQEKAAEADQAKLRKKGENLEAINIRLRNAGEAREAADATAAEQIAALQQYKTTALKDGLLGISDAYLDYHERAAVFFRAQRDIAALLPEDIFETDRDLTYRQELIDRANAVLQDTDDRLAKADQAVQQRDLEYAGGDVYRQYGSNITATTWDSNEGLSGFESEEGDEIVMERDEFGHVYAQPLPSAGNNPPSYNSAPVPPTPTPYAKSPLRSADGSPKAAPRAVPRRTPSSPKPVPKPRPASMQPPPGYEQADASESEHIYSAPPPRRGAPPAPPLN